MAYPDIVQITKLETAISGDHTTHYHHAGDPSKGLRPRKVEEKWHRKTREIGSGGFGTVWLHECVTGTRVGQLRAVKEIKKKASSRFVRELEAIGRFSLEPYRHCFVRSFGWYETGDRLFVVMEYLPHGDLSGYLHRRLSEAEAGYITSQILEGLGYMHQGGFVHRDLKPQNILVQERGPRWWVKIADFGITKRMLADNSLTTAVGTDAYMAPEQAGLRPLADERADKGPATAVDIWAAGILAWFMVTNTRAFKSRSDLFSYAVQGQALPLESSNVSDELADFVAGTLARSATERPSCKDARNHAWIQQYDEPPTNSETCALIQAAERLEIDDETIRDSDYASWTTKSGQSTVFGSSVTQILESHTASHPDPTSPSSKGAQDRHDTENRRPISEPSSKPEPTQDTEASLRPIFIEKRDTLGIAHESTRQVARRLGPVLFLLKKHEDLEHFYRPLYESWKSALGSGHGDTLWAAHMLGEFLFGLPIAQETEHYFRKLLGEWRTVLGPEHRETLWATHKLAGIVAITAPKTGEAIKLYLQAYRGRERTLGAYHEETLRSLHWAGQWQLLQGDYRAAEEALSKCYNALEDKSVEALSKNLVLCQGYAKALEQQSKYTEAETVFKQVVDIKLKTFGQQHRETISSLHSLASMMHYQAKHSEAEKAYRDTHAIAQKVLGTEDQTTLQISYNLSNVLCAREKHSEALPIYQNIYYTRRKLLGEGHMETLNAVHRMAGALKSLGRYQEAEQRYRTAVYGRASLLGQSHRETLRSKHFLAVVLAAQGDHRRAQYYFHQVYDARKPTLGTEHPDTLESLHGYGESLHMLGMYDEAATLLTRAYKAREASLGKNHPDTLRSLYCISDTLYHKSDLPNAASGLKRAVRGMESAFGKHHAETRLSFEKLHKILLLQGKQEDADSWARAFPHFRVDSNERT